MQAWDMVQPADLFKIYDPEDEFLNNGHHLAAMIALLGPPPREFLDRSQESLKYWDENGQYLPPTKLLAANQNSVYISR